MGIFAHPGGSESKAQHEDEDHHHCADGFTAAEENLERALPDNLIDDTGHTREKECSEDDRDCAAFQKGFPVLREVIGWAHPVSVTQNRFSGEENPLPMVLATETGDADRRRRIRSRRACL